MKTLILVLALCLSTLATAQAPSPRMFDDGEKIARYTNTCLVALYALSDEDLTFTQEFVAGKADYYGYTHPTLFVTMKLKSQPLNNPLVTYKIMLEKSNNGFIIGTIYGMSVNDKVDNDFSIINKTSYRCTSSGVTQIR